MVCNFYLDGLMDDLRCYVLFNNILVISERVGESERLCAKEPCLQLKRFPLLAGLITGAKLYLWIQYIYVNI